MKVRELIAALQAADPECSVVVDPWGPEVTLPGRVTSAAQYDDGLFIIETERMSKQDVVDLSKGEVKG